MSSLQAYSQAYGAVFVWHGAFAALAWLLLAPLGHILAKLQRKQSPSRAFEWHRMLMLMSAVLTVATFVMGVVCSKGKAPLVHKMLGSALLFLVALQVSAGVLRPEKGGEGRRTWRGLHGGVGLGVMVLGAYLVKHSLFVFDVGKGVEWAVGGGILIMGGGVLGVHVWSWRMEKGESEEGLLRMEDGKGESEREEEELLRMEAR